MPGIVRVIAKEKKRKNFKRRELTRYGYKSSELAKTLHDCPKEDANYGETQEKAGGSCSREAGSHPNKVARTDYATNCHHHLQFDKGQYNQMARGHSPWVLPGGAEPATASEAPRYMQNQYDLFPSSSCRWSQGHQSSICRGRSQQAPL